MPSGSSESRGSSDHSPDCDCCCCCCCLLLLLFCLFVCFCAVVLVVLVRVVGCCLFVVCRLLVVGWWLLVGGCCCCWLLVGGCWLVVVVVVGGGGLVVVVVVFKGRRGWYQILLFKALMSWDDRRIEVDTSPLFPHAGSAPKVTLRILWGSRDAWRIRYLREVVKLLTHFWEK